MVGEKVASTFRAKTVHTLNLDFCQCEVSLRPNRFHRAGSDTFSYQFLDHQISGKATWTLCLSQRNDNAFLRKCGLVGTDLHSTAVFEINNQFVRLFL